MTTEKEMLKEILSTLATIKNGHLSTFTVSFWTTKYQEDITWVLKQLATQKRTTKELTKRTQSIQKQLIVLEQVSKELMKELREIIEEFSKGL